MSHRRGLKPTVPRQGFTIIELLVSIGIFVISSALMFGALFGATEVFRKGEAARQAGDEATVVISALQEDLSRATPIRLREGVPAAEWGRVYATVDPDGNCLLAMVVENPDRAQVRWVPDDTDPDRILVGLRKRVVWFVQPGTSPNATSADDELVREEWDISANGQVVDAAGDPVNWPTDATKTPLRRDVVTKGCLNFSVWIELAQAHRTVASGIGGPYPAWESTTERVLPFKGGGAFDTHELETRAPPDFYPQPDALRISLVLTGGGRFATRGTLIDASGTDNWRISGIKALPTITGSLLRIGNEWIRYNDFRKGVLSGVQPAQLRSQPGTRTRGETVLAGLPFSLVVALPR